MQSIVLPYQVNGLMSENRNKVKALHLKQNGEKLRAIVIGRAGMDLYPELQDGKIRDATSFTADLGGSAGNIAVAMCRAGASVAMLTGLSKDPVGDFVLKKLEIFGVDRELITITEGNERTSLALAEVRKDDCEVVIYRNNPADLSFQLTDVSREALKKANHVVITGTSLIDADSRSNTIEAMKIAKSNDCNIWFDLDYRKFNWIDENETRKVYSEAASYCDVIVGNEEEFSILDKDLDALIENYRQENKVIILKRGSGGSSLFAGETRLDSGIYPLTPLKPYGAGDAFLGNLLVNYHAQQNWQEAIKMGSAAAAIVVSKRGCSSAMPAPNEIEQLLKEQQMTPSANWC